MSDGGEVRPDASDRTNPSRSGPTIDARTHIELHPLFRRYDGEEWILGREETAQFIAVPPLGVEAVELFEEGFSVGEVTQRLSAQYGETVEVRSFVDDLVALGFVAAVDGHRLDTANKKVKGSHLAWIRPHHVHFLFSTPAKAVYLFLATFALCIVVAEPHIYFPRYDHYFFHPRYSVMVLTSMALGWVLVFKHELFHLFAAKHVGVEGRFGISRRLHYIVAETDVTALWTVPRQRRYIVYLAGMISDALLISVVLIVLFFGRLGIEPLPVPGTLLYRFCQMLVMLEWAHILWQFKFFLRTDIYYVIATLLDCKNLHGDAKRHLRNRLAPVVPMLQRRPAPNIPHRERPYVKVYAVLLIVGVGVMLTVVAYYGALPVIVLLHGVLLNLLAGPATGAPFIDAVVVLAINIFTIALFFVIIVRERRAKKAAQAPPPY